MDQVQNFCTIDRSRLRRRPSAVNDAFQTRNVVEKKDFSTQTLPRKPVRRNLSQAGSVVKSNLAKKRSKSVDILDRDPVSCERAIKEEFAAANESGEKSLPHYLSTNYIGDCGIDELKRVASEHLGNGTNTIQKSVKIHPDVTEFRYPGNLFT